MYYDKIKYDTRYFLEPRPIGKSGQMGAGIPVTYGFMMSTRPSQTLSTLRKMTYHKQENLRLRIRMAGSKAEGHGRKPACAYSHRKYQNGCRTGKNPPSPLIPL